MRTSLLKKGATVAVIWFAAMVVWVNSALSEPKKTVVLLETMPVPVVLEHSRWFIKGMEQFGYTADQTITLIRYNIDGDRHKARRFMENMLAEITPALVVTNATLATQEAQAFLEKNNIPQLFITVADPVGSGIISQSNRPTGTHLTGRIYSLDQEIKINNTLRLIKQLPLKRPIRFGVIYSSYPSSMGQVEDLEREGALHSDIAFVFHKIEYRSVPEGVPAMMDDVKKAISLLEDSVDFWWEVAGPLGELPEYDGLLHKHSSHPVVFANTLSSVRDRGGLLYMSPDVVKYGMEAARVAHDILSGVYPGTIPVVTPEAFVMAINLKTALRLGIVIPSDMIRLAGKHVY